MIHYSPRIQKQRLLLLILPRIRIRIFYMTIQKQRLLLLIPRF